MSLCRVNNQLAFDLSLQNALYIIMELMTCSKLPAKKNILVSVGYKRHGVMLQNNWRYGICLVNGGAS